MRRIVIAIDFDDTLVKRVNKAPLDIEDCGAVPWVHALQCMPRVHLILWTCRTKHYGLPAALEWIASQGLIMEVNENREWETHIETLGPGRKVLADLYVDDKGLGIPLREDGVVDWERTGPMLLDWVAKRLFNL